MKRTIKFKAKCLDNGEWVEGYYIKKPSYHQTPKGDVVEDGEEHLIFGMTNDDVQPLCYEVDPSTVCQFTGIYDKHGLEVWEHDILIVNAYRGEVVYNKGGFAVNNGHMEIAIDTCIFQIPNSNRSHVINIGSKFDRKEEK